MVLTPFLMLEYLSSPRSALFRVQRAKPSLICRMDSVLPKTKALVCLYLLLLSSFMVIKLDIATISLN